MLDIVLLLLFCVPTWRRQTVRQGNHSYGHSEERNVDSASSQDLSHELSVPTAANTACVPTEREEEERRRYKHRFEIISIQTTTLLLFTALHCQSGIN